MELNIQLPDFLIIGAQKAGTTSLHYYCKQHPQIFMADVKEPMFFSATEPPKTTPEQQTAENPYSFFYLEEYADLFKGAGRAKAPGEPYLSYLARRFFSFSSPPVIGEASTSSLAIPSSSMLIKKIIPNVKIIVILRNPLHRAFSAHKMYSENGMDQRSFEEAMEIGVKGQELTVPLAQRYLTLGLYANQLAPFLKLFPKEHIFIGDYDEFDSDNIGFLQKVFRFLQVDEFVPKDLKRLNVFSNKAINLDKLLEEKIKAFFKEDVMALQEIVDFDVHKWLA